MLRDLVKLKLFWRRWTTNSVFSARITLHDNLQLFDALRIASKSISSFKRITSRSRTSTKFMFFCTFVSSDNIAISVNDQRANVMPNKQIKGENVGRQRLIFCTPSVHPLLTNIASIARIAASDRIIRVIAAMLLIGVYRRGAKGQSFEICRNYKHLTCCIDVRFQFGNEYLLSVFFRIIDSNGSILLIARWANKELHSSDTLKYTRSIEANKARFRQRFPAQTTFEIAEILRTDIFRQCLMTITYLAELYCVRSILL